MKLKPVNRFQKILFYFTCLIVLMTLGVCAVPFISDGEFWIISMLGLGFLFLIITLIILTIWWSILRSALLLLPLIALLLSFKQISVLFGRNVLGKEFVKEKKDGTIRVMSWNVLRMDEYNRSKRGGISFRPAIIQSIVDEQPDIVCLQEFFEPATDRYFRKNIDTLQQLGFAHHYFVPTSVTVNGEYKYGMAIFSKYPIVDTGATGFKPTAHSEGLIYADVNVNNKTMRVFSVHMESFRGSKHGYGADGGVMQILRNFRKTYWTKNVQADRVDEAIKSSPHPVILCGNLGDIPNSYAYFKVKGNLKDAFLEKGKGLGATFRYILPTLRLDYILADPKTTVTQYEMPRLEYSDHYPLIADLKFH